jgi:hypothetical protein
MAALTAQAGSLALGAGGEAVEWAMVGSAAQGQTLSGDRHLVAALGGGALFAVVDAIGHGKAAFTVAELAITALREAGERSLETLVQRCHQQLRGTRGVVLALASFEGEGVLTWLTIGNVAVVLMRRRFGRMQPYASAVAQGGILGTRLPALNPRTLELRPGDILLMATDGISLDLAEDLKPDTDLITTSQRLMTQYQISSDDGLLLAARYAGRPR